VNIVGGKAVKGENKGTGARKGKDPLAYGPLWEKKNQRWDGGTRRTKILK